jgi:hypothetical protein
MSNGDRKFSKYPPMPSWATKKFQLPCDGAGVSDGDQIVLVTIQHNFIV